MNIDEAKPEILRRAKPIWEKYISGCQNSARKEIVQYQIGIQEELKQEISALILNYKIEQNDTALAFELDEFINGLMYNINYYLSIGLGAKELS